MPTPVKIPVVAQTVVRHTDTVKTLLLRPLKRLPAFRPGQFLHLAIDPYDPAGFWPESRVFSIAGSPGRDLLRVVFSVKGAFTSRMFNEIGEGDALTVKLPYGSFLFEADRPLVLIAGGTGITPFISLLEHCLDKPSPARISLYYGMRSSADFVCSDVLRECTRTMSGFRCTCCFEDGGLVEGMDRCEKGIIPIDEIIAENRTQKESLYYLSGPPEMIRSARSRIAAAGIDESNIRVDDWE